MKLLLSAIPVIFLVVGCAHGTPIDILIPTKKPSPVTVKYLDELYPDYKANRMYHSLADTKFEKAMIPLRKMQLEGMYLAAKGEVGVIDAAGSAMSKGAWAAIIAGVGLAGWQLPRPQEKLKVLEAEHRPPPTVPPAV